MIDINLNSSKIMNVENLKKMDQTEKILILITYVLALQVLRNISTVGYIGLLFTCYFMLYGVFFFESKIKIDEIVINKLTGAKLIFLVTYLFLPIPTLINSQFASIAISRYLVTFPFILFCFIYPYFRLDLLNKILKGFVFISVLSAISILIQILTGPISFFTDSSYREGLERFTSLSGSLTIFGTTGSMALLFVLVNKNEYSKLLRSMYILFLVSGLLCSLQKSAIANMAIVLLIYLFFS